MRHVEIIVFDRNIPEHASERFDRVTYVQGTVTIRDHLDRLMRINDRWDEKLEVVKDLDEFEEVEQDDDGNYIGVQQEGMLEPNVEDMHLRKCKYPPTCVFLCAGLMPSMEHTDEDFQLINGMGSMNVVDSCISANVKHLFYFLCQRCSEQGREGTMGPMRNTTKASIGLIMTQFLTALQKKTS